MNEKSFFDKTITFLDHPSPDGATVGVGVAVIAGLGSGIGTYKLIKEVGFPANDQYEAVNKEIDSAALSIQQLMEASETYRAQGLTSEITNAQKKISDYQVLIAQKEQALPQGYNPHVEGGFSGSGAVLAFTLVTIGIRNFIQNKARALRSS